MFEVIFKGSVRVIVASDVLPSLTTVAKHSVSIKLVIGKAADTFDGVWFFLLEMTQEPVRFGATSAPSREWWPMAKGSAWCGREEFSPII